MSREKPGEFPSSEKISDLCGALHFHVFLREHYGDEFVKFSKVSRSILDQSARFVCSFCEVPDIPSIKDGTHSAEKFAEIYAPFKIWKKAKFYAG